MPGVAWMRAACALCLRTGDAHARHASQLADAQCYQGLDRERLQAQCPYTSPWSQFLTIPYTSSRLAGGYQQGAVSSGLSANLAPPRYVQNTPRHQLPPMRPRLHQLSSAQRGIQAQRSTPGRLTGYLAGARATPEAGLCSATRRDNALDDDTSRQGQHFAQLAVGLILH